MMMADKKMPKRADLGQFMSSTVGTAIHQWRDKTYPNPHGYRVVMGYFLPPWQRGLVWTEAQNIRLLESLWRGLNIGTYTFNRSKKYGGRLDNLLIDGQQRMNAIQLYLQDAFPVFGYRFSEITDVDRRGFEMTTHFHCYITSSEDEAYLREYYNMMNFGGVAHKDGEQA
jgi:uncharacterized protein with ParB-like and HNH nuclease domain